jgi:hypothetical protein
MRSWMSLPLILVVVVIIRSLPVPGSQFHNEAPAITFQPYSECYLFSRFVYHRSFLSSQVTSQVICILHNPRGTREYRPYIVIINSI